MGPRIKPGASSLSGGVADRPPSRDKGVCLLLAMLRPRAYLPSIADLDPPALSAAGIKGVIFDLDNTLVPWRQPRAPDGLKAWLQGLQRRGFRLCILSNNRRQRVQAFSAEVGVPGVCGIKPGRPGFLRALAVLGTAPSQTAVVGDQVFTDVLGGNRLGLYTILVVPRSAREFPMTRVVRQVEALVLRVMARRGWITLLPRPAVARPGLAADAAPRPPAR